MNSICLSGASLIFATIFAFVALPTTTSAQEAPAGTPPPIIVEDDALTPEFGNIPAEFLAAGRLFDQDGDTISGASVKSGSGETSTDDEGRFSLQVTKNETVVISHPDHVERELLGRDLYAGNGGETIIETVKYTEFVIEAKGGTYRANGIRIRAPRDAVTEDTTVKVAALPLYMTYEGTGGIEMTRAAGVELLPAGLSFAKPIEVRVPLINPLEGDEADVLVLDNEDGTYSEDATASVALSRRYATFTLSHFSRWTAGSPSQGMRTRLVGRTQDLNGDAQVNAADALLALFLSGGPQKMSIDQVTTRTQVFSASSAAARSRSSGSETSGGASVAVTGVKYGVTESLSESQSSEITRKTGLQISQSVSRTLKAEQTVAEYDDACTFLFGWFDLVEVQEWETADLLAWEIRQLDQAYGDSTDLKYMQWDLPDTFAIGRNLLGRNRLAISGPKSDRKYYILKAKYIVRVPRGNDTTSCEIRNIGRRINEKLQGSSTTGAMQGAMDGFSAFGGGKSVDQADFDQTGIGYSSTRLIGWGILENGDKRFLTRRECKVAVITESETISSSVQITDNETRNEAQSRSRSSGSSTSVDYTVPSSVPLVGGVGLSGSAGGSTSSGSGTSTSDESGSTASTAVSGTISWSVEKGHDEHMSDHMLAELHVATEGRGWTKASQHFPASAQRKFRDNPGLARAFGKTASGGTVMWTPNGDTFVASDPVLTLRHIGYALVRYSEETCLTQTDIDAREEPSTGVRLGPTRVRPRTGSDESASTGTSLPAGVCRAASDPFADPCPSVSDEDETTVTGTSEPVSTGVVFDVTFTDISGDTEVNGSFLDGYEMVMITAVDQEEPRQADEDEIIVTEDEDGDYTVNVAPELDITSVFLIGGNGGGIRYDIEPEPSYGPPGLLWPTDGAVNVESGTISETLQVPDAIIADDAPLSEYQVGVETPRPTTDQTPASDEADPEGTSDVPRPEVNVIARHGNEFALEGRGLSSSAVADSGLTIAIRSPNGATVQGDVPAWGWELSAQPVTEIDTWAPVFFQCIGLPASEIITINFKPASYQGIEPLVVQRPCGAMSGVTQVGNYRTSRIGPQPLRAKVERSSAF